MTTCCEIGIYTGSNRAEGGHYCCIFFIKVALLTASTASTTGINFHPELHSCNQAPSIPFTFSSVVKLSNLHPVFHWGIPSSHHFQLD
ncbi:hypothetical protein AOLI_G00266890 [Acnodon oligacanthus]